MSAARMVGAMPKDKQTPEKPASQQLLLAFMLCR